MILIWTYVFAVNSCFQCFLQAFFGYNLILCHTHRTNHPLSRERRKNITIFLLGLSKGNARVEIWASFFFFFFVQPQFAIKSLIRMRDDLTLMCAWHGVMADEERFMRWKISTNTVKNTLKTDTKYSHSVRGRPTLKVEERCRNGLVRKPYERSLWANIYDWTSHREKHKLKSFPLTVYIINNPASSAYRDKNSYEINP